MESTDYSYLDLNDKLQNYVIQNNEENFGLQYHNGLNVEPIFAEVDCSDGTTWTQYELPVLMNGSLMSGRFIFKKRSNFITQQMPFLSFAEQPVSPFLNQEELGVYDESANELIDNTTTLTYPIEVFY